MPVNDELMGRLEGILEGVQKSIQDFQKLFYGNGQPGALQRLTIAETDIETLACDLKEDREEDAKFRAEMRESAKRMEKSVSDLADIIKAHIEDKEKHTVKGLFLKKDIIWQIGSGFVLGFLFLHTLLPSQINLGDLILKLVGAK